MKRKGLSPVIATVMIIMVTVAAAALIMGFVLPFITEQTESSSECFEVFPKGVEIGSTAYNCFLNTSVDCETGVACNSRSGFSIKVNKEGVAGFKVSLTGNGESTAYVINGNNSYDKLRDLNGNFDVELGIPGSGGMKTYVANGTYESIQVLPILEGGRECEVTDKEILSLCHGDAVGLIHSP
jgi:flagellin-like protein